MPNPSAHEMVSPRDEIGVVRRSPSKEQENFIANLRRAPFIGIDAQNPLVPTGSHRLVSQLPTPFERNLHDPCAHSFRDRRCIIRASRIRDNDFISPEDAPYRLLDLFRFVKGNNVRGDFVHPIELLSKSFMRWLQLGSRAGRENFPVSDVRIANPRRDKGCHEEGCVGIPAATSARSRGGAAAKSEPRNVMSRCPSAKVLK